MIDKEELAEFLKENLSIKVEKLCAWAEHKGWYIKLYLDKEEISKSILWKDGGR
jgi:hypothetical protein